MGRLRRILVIGLLFAVMVFLVGCGKTEHDLIPSGTYDAGAYTVEIPAYYEEKCFVEYKEGRLDFYDAKTYDTSGGLLFSIVEYKDDTYKEHTYEIHNKKEKYYDVLGSFGAVKYVAVYPIEAQYNIANTIEYYRYTKMLSMVEDIVKSFRLK